MNETMVAEAMIIQREADYRTNSFQREWREMHAIDQLEINLKRRRRRLAMRYHLTGVPTPG